MAHAELESDGKLAAGQLKSGVIQDTGNGNISYNGSTLTVAGLAATTITDVGATSGRVVVYGASGVLTEDSDLTFATDTLTATKIVGSTSIKVGTAAGYKSSDGSSGATVSFTALTGETVTVKDGIITSIDL